jgi:hypothetical protein
MELKKTGNEIKKTGLAKAEAFDEQRRETLIINLIKNRMPMEKDR